MDPKAVPDPTHSLGQVILSDKLQGYFEQAEEKCQIGQHQYAAIWYCRILEQCPGHVESTARLLDCLEVGGRAPDLTSGDLDGEVASFLKALILYGQNQDAPERALAAIQAAMEACLAETAISLFQRAHQHFDIPDPRKPRLVAAKMADIAQYASSQSLATVAEEFIELAARFDPESDHIRELQKDISALVSISRLETSGDHGNFRDIVRGGEEQLQEHSAKESDQQTLQAEAIASARDELAKNPNDKHSLNKLVDLLVSRNRRTEALELLADGYDRTRDSDLDRKRLELEIRYAKEDWDQARRANASAQQVEEARHDYLAIRVRNRGAIAEKYPTDSRAQFDFGHALYDLRRFDEAIPPLQAMSSGERLFTKAQIMVGLSFIEIGGRDHVAARIFESLLEECKDEEDLLQIHYGRFQASFRIFEKYGRPEDFDAALSSSAELLRRRYPFVAVEELTDKLIHLREQGH